MAAMSRLLPMMAFSTFAIFLLALLATPTNALATEPHAHLARGHDSVAKRKRSAEKRAKRCRPKTSSAPAPASTAPAYSPAPTKAPTTSKAPYTTPAASTSRAVSTTVAAPSPGGGGSGNTGLDPNKKLILAWPNGPYGFEKWAGSKVVGGVYSWSPDDPTKGTGYPFFPMVWGFNQKSSFMSKVDGSKYKLCFGQNEPNQDGQSDMSPQDGAALWKATIESARKQGCKTVSPATTSAPSGIKWVQDFLKACDGCTVDIIALHWYDVDVEAFKKYVTNFYNTFKKPIIVSEYACQNFNGGAQCSKDQTWALHTGIAKWFHQTPWIVGFAPFGVMHQMQGVNSFNQLMSPDGGQTDLGRWYMNGEYMN
ncbi:hypothetical protein FRC07_001144 [Ceratobasidium sp. 392]|nr:hypothetical protein FRC07_001144 [Ceratobasidium sp. 392]